MLFFPYSSQTFPHIGYTKKTFLNRNWKYYVTYLQLWQFVVNTAEYLYSRYHQCDGYPPWIQVRIRLCEALSSLKLLMRIPFLSPTAYLLSVHDVDDHALHELPHHEQEADSSCRQGQAAAAGWCKEGWSEGRVGVITYY